MCTQTTYMHIGAYRDLGFWILDTVLRNQQVHGNIFRVCGVNFIIYLH